METFDNIVDKVTQSGPQEFNTEIHTTHKDGTPKYNKDGTFKRKRGQKEVDSSIEVSAETTEPMHDEMGNTMAISITSCCTMILGQEWKPEQNEVDALAQAWAAYFKHAGVQQFPPWVMLTMVHVGYAGKRLAMPETKGRVGSWIQRWRQRRYARSNRGNNVQREDNPSQESGPELSS